MRSRPPTLQRKPGLRSVKAPACTGAGQLGFEPRQAGLSQGYHTLATEFLGPGALALSDGEAGDIQG